MSLSSSPSPLEIAKSQTHPSYDHTSSWQYTGTRSSASAVPDDECYDFITILEACQNLDIDFLPITWQPALDSLGAGGQAEVRQSLVNIAMSFAFSLVKIPKSTQEVERAVYQALRSQISILAHPEIRNHPNLISLIGICWDIRPEEREAWNQDKEEGGDAKARADDQESWTTPQAQQWRVWPVLVYEKTKHGDLVCFMKSQHGKDLDMTGKLKLCTDIAKGIRAMHRNPIVHMDIKPHNVLVFEKEPGEYTAKVSDLGFSIQLESDNDYVDMPQSFPWNAPEWHHRGHRYPEIAEMDIYAFGMVCWWLLFERECLSEGIIFHAYEQDQSWRLRDLKHENQLVLLAMDMARQSAKLSKDQKQSLAKFFEFCLAPKASIRESGIDQLLHNLSVYPAAKTGSTYSGDTKQEMDKPWQLFTISKTIMHFYTADYRVRAYIASCLQHRISKREVIQKYDVVASRNDMFQLAVCFQLGFGVPRNHQVVTRLLQENDSSLNEIHSERKAIREEYSTIYNNNLRDLYKQGHIVTIDFGHFYREHNILDDAKSKLEEEIRGLSLELSDSCSIVLLLKSLLAPILRSEGDWTETEKLEVQVMETSKRVLGVEHPSTLASIANLALTYSEQGRWEKAEELQVQVMKISKRVLGVEHRSTAASIANLASTYSEQGRWEKAEELQVQLIEVSKRVLGVEYPSTLTTIANLALTYWKQGYWEKAEELQVQVMKISKRVLGVEHRSTLTSTANLALTYSDQGRWEKAEELQVQVMKISKRVLGVEHRSTLTSTANLALTYWRQGRWEKAEELLVQVIETSKRVPGVEHPSTLTSITHLAWIYLESGRWEKAEELLVQVIEASKRVFGVEHPSTLASISYLASTYRKQGRWEKAEELEVQLIETTKRVLGVEHLSTLTSIANLALTYSDQGRLGKAEELQVQVMETRKRVLGVEHPSTLTSIANLAWTYRKQGRWEKAEELQVQVMETSKRVLRVEHPSTLTSMANLASTYWNQGRLKEAEELEVQVIEIRTRVLGEEPSHL